VRIMIMKGAAMSTPIDATRAWEHEFRVRFGAVPTGKEDPVEYERLARLCNDLLVERDRARADLVRMQAERDQYLKSLYALTHKEFAIDKSEAMAHFGKQPPLADLLAELEAQGEGT
jgi:hypothetical protein